MEEFLEAEVLWPETISSKNPTKGTISNFGDRHSQDTRHNSESPPSSPITIPCSSSGHHLSRENMKWCYEEECSELVPPHVMVSRKISNGGEMAISLRSGQGRTLRGRELWHIRNAVWRMTGFVDG